MRCLVCLLEGPSEREMLKSLLPRFLNDEIEVHYIVFEGKQDLEKQLPLKLRAWQLPGCKFVVLRDKDSGDCVVIRKGLVKKCGMAGKSDALVRIAIHELESWYLGDLAAVEAGLGVSNLAYKQASRKFREPDALSNPAQELRKLTTDKYQKISGSRAIGPHLSIKNNRSKSYRKFISGLKKIL